MSKPSYTFGDIRPGPRARHLLMEAIESGWISAGKNVALFEQRYRETFGYHEAVAVSSGTAAVFTAVAALHDLGGAWGDEIIVPALSFVATANAVAAAGFTPVFVDIDRATLNIDPKLIEAAITPKTRGIVVVHTMGKPCDMDAIQDVATKHKLHVIEDACEAHGAKYGDRFVGALGAFGAFSFYAAHLICAGEGGMVTAQNADLAALARSVRSHGRPDGTIYFQFDRFGFNTKMNDLEAAVGVEGIENFQDTFDKRKKNLNYLLEGMKDLEHVFYLTKEEPWETISPHAFQMTLKEDIPIVFQDFHAHLEKQGIQTKLNFGSLPTQHRAFERLGHKKGDFPEAEYVGDRGLHVGCHQYLEKKHLDYLLEVVHDYVTKKL